MSSVFVRGTRSNPRFFVRYKDATGKWSSRRVTQQTRHGALKIARKIEEEEEQRRYRVKGPAGSELSVKELIEKFLGSQVNREAKNERYRINKYLIPRFGALHIQDIRPAEILLWLDELRSSKKLKSGSQLGLFRLLSRFCSWAVGREFMESNPCSKIPTKQRPQESPPSEGCIVTEAMLESAMALLPPPFGYMFFLGNKCGMKQGEARGLRMSDLANLEVGTIRIRFTGSQRLVRRSLGLSRDKAGGSRRCRHVEIPEGVFAATVLGPWLESRRAKGAGAEDLAFPREGRYCFGKDKVIQVWDKFRDQIGLPGVSWQDATRTACAVRMAMEGHSIYRISALLGHSSVLTTEEMLRHVANGSSAKRNKDDDGEGEENT
jgi:integrase